LDKDVASIVEPFYSDEHFSVEIEWAAEQPVAFVHLGLKQWTPSCAKTMRRLLVEVEALAREKGCRHLCMYNPQQTDTWKTFLEKFIKYKPLFYLENGHVVYGRSL
jgi:hypothetical protein